MYGQNRHFGERFYTLLSVHGSVACLTANAINDGPPLAVDSCDWSVTLLVIRVIYLVSVNFAEVTVGLASLTFSCQTVF